jgi:microcystin-dependent protein
MHPGQGPGLSLHDLGETGGSEFVTLLESEIPAHNHVYSVSTQLALENSPQDQNVAMGDGINLYASPNPLVSMSEMALAPAGGDQPHNNMQPYLTLNFNIALQGVFPPRG